MNDNELIASIRKDPSEFEILFRLYYRPIFGYILRRTGNPVHAADITADTFLKAFLHIKKYSYRGIPLKSWLYRIATNEVNMYFRNDQKFQQVIKAFVLENERQFARDLRQDIERLEAELELHTRYLEIQKNLKSLPFKYQEVIALKYFEGKNNKEISLILGIKAGTLKSLLSRGIEKLRNLCNPI